MSAATQKDFWSSYGALPIKPGMSAGLFNAVD
jgi:hypothetical protein